MNFNLLRYISLKHIGSQKSRLIMLFVGICLGVTALVSIDIVTRSVYHSFEESVNQVAGRTILEVSAGEAGFPEQLLEQVQKVPGVAHAVPAIETIANLNTKSVHTLTILGVEVQQDQQIRDYHIYGQPTYIRNPLMLLAKPNTVLITQTLAKREGIKKDDSLRLETLQGIKTYKVVGLLYPEGPAKVAGGDMVVMDIHTAQIAFGKGGCIDRIDLTLLPGQTRDSMRNRLKEILPEGYLVEPPAFRIKQTVSLLKIFWPGYYSMGFFALVVGLYLIFNSAYISVVQRRKEIGILRIIGATRGQIIRLFLSETLIISFLASLLGLVLGIFFAKFTIELVPIKDMSGVSFIKNSIYSLIINPWDMTKDFSIGIFASLLVAIFPALAASRLSPISATCLQPYSWEYSPLGNKMVRWAIVFFLLSLLMAALNYVIAFNTFIFLLPVILFLIGLSLCLPLYLRGLITIFRRLSSRLAAGRLAVLNLQKNSFRNAVVLGAIAVSISIFVFGTNVFNNFRNFTVTYSDSFFQADMYITTGGISAGNIIPMPSKMAKEIENIPGVLSVIPSRYIRMIFKNLNAELISSDLTQRLACAPPTWLDQGQRKDLLRLLPNQNNIMINDVLATRYNLQQGQSLILPTPQGTLSFTVVAIGPIVSRSGGGVILMDNHTYQRYWQDTKVDSFAIILDSKNNFSSVCQTIIDRFGKERRIFVSSANDLKEKMEKNLSHGFLVLNTITIISLFIACLGIAITLVAATLERRQEIGILRAIGMTKRQITHIFIIESILIGVGGGALGLTTGLLLSWRFWESLVRPLYGESLIYHIQYTPLIWAFVLSIGLSILAGLYPARQAAKTNIAEALSYE